MKDLYYKCGLFVLKYEGPIMGSIIGILASFVVHEIMPPLLSML